ncbi:MAG TPA: hypothetical protein VEH27_08020 [Methylomirabilota bacterium]|nr:hypothetical protein [Methylomirabilota bacterium]
MNDRKLPDVATPESLNQLRDIRRALLDLHKLLLETERAAYERSFGRVNSSELLRLVIEDARFAWLHTISELIVNMDEVLDGEPPATAIAVTSLVDLADRTLHPAEPGSAFQIKYHAALQAEPDVIFAHRDTLKVISKAKGGTLSSSARN